MAQGSGAGPFQNIDFTARVPSDFAAGAIYEQFTADGFGYRIDTAAVAQEFYRTHADKHDYLVIFTNFVVNLGGASALSLGVQNQTRGLGRSLINNLARYGSGGELESVLLMNNIENYWPTAANMVDPPIIPRMRITWAPTLFGSPGTFEIFRSVRRDGSVNGDFGFSGTSTILLNSAMSLMAQEAGHRWGSTARFVHPVTGIGADSSDLLGRSNSHWSFFFNTEAPAGQFEGEPWASSMEGNSLADLGASAMMCPASGQYLFQSKPNQLTDGYHPLDLYLMGLLPAANVGSFWYVDDPRNAYTGQSVNGLRGVEPTRDIVFCGKRVNLNIGSVQSHPSMGPRIPTLGDENDDGQGNDVKTMAFILVVSNGSPDAPLNAADIQQVDTFRRTWQWYVNGPATSGLGKFDTSLSPTVY